MKKITLFITVLTLCLNSVNAQTNFGWETAVDNGDNTTETIDGITLTTSTPDGLGITDFSDILGTNANVASTNTTSTVTFSFDQAVAVNYIIPLELSGADPDFTFTPTGGTNMPVTVSMSGAAAPGTFVDLNWIGVTSFTVTSSSPVLIAFDNLSVYPVSSEVNFGWETAVDNGDNTTESIDGITLTTSTPDGLGITDFSDILGTNANVASTNTTSTVTFSFDQAVAVNYIIPLELSGADPDFTFTPTGGTNMPVTVSMSGAAAPGTFVDLNWIGVTSFTVTSSSPVLIAFDNLSVRALQTLSIPNNFKVQKAIVYPNPVESILRIKNVSDVKSINLYNNLGQKILQTKSQSIDVSNLSKGLYFVKINTSAGSETRRIIKK